MPSFSHVLSLASLAGVSWAQQYMFIFGDSYTATNSYSGFTPSAGWPSESNPIGNPALPGSTFSGGANWVGDLLTDYATTTTLGYNFAVGGATVDNSIVEGSTSTDFVTQVQAWSQYLATPPSEAPWTADTAIAGAFFGINDLLGAYWAGQTPPYSEIVSQYMAQFQTLYDAGVRNFFVMTVPPLEDIQIVHGDSTVAGYVDEYNSELSAALDSFASSNADIGVAVVVDTSSAFETAVSNPSAYGAPDATCTNTDGTSCLWYDTIHPGEAIQDLFAQAVASALEGSFF
ncbi:GDSL lipase/esterase [Xylariomycetidae sp. FL0641]|nr:GDSL lipase/esterase [Xylariomycetidae sp. FL0641]